MAERDDEELDVQELLGWAEFCCWSALVMAPIIYWLQGPSVSSDQFAVRTALVVIAAIGGAGLRVRALVQKFRSIRSGLSAANESARKDRPGPNA